MAATHWEVDGATLCGRNATCGQRILLLTTTDPRSVTCKRCLRALTAPVFVGQNRNREQFKLTCVGGPWDGQDVVFPKQEGSQYGGEMSLPIRVGEHVGRYNLNTGHWVPLEKA